jgi:hypothetical protein
MDPNHERIVPLAHPANEAILGIVSLKNLSAVQKISITYVPTLCDICIRFITLDLQ